MVVKETGFDGALVLEIEPRNDSRGFFARAFCRRELEAVGVNFEIVQANLAFTHRPGVVRGLHYQIPPSAESKLVRCLHGAVFDVIVDLRPKSPTFLRHFGIKLCASLRNSLLIPAGFAHGYQTLTEEAEVNYLVNAYYSPEYERGIRFDDPKLGIKWPLDPVEVSPKDLSWPLLDL